MDEQRFQLLVESLDRKVTSSIAKLAASVPLTEGAAIIGTPGDRRVVSMTPNGRNVAKLGNFSK